MSVNLIFYLSIKVYNVCLFTTYGVISTRFNYYEVQLGMLRRRSFTPHQKTHAVDRVVPHPKFNIVTLEYDLVLLRTTSPVPFDHWTRPICLPSGTDTRYGQDKPKTLVQEKHALKWSPNAFKYSAPQSSISQICMSFM